MKELIEKFPAQLRQAVDIARASELTPAPVEIQNTVISGLGGSGIGGSIASQLVELSAKCPIIVNKKYTLPEFVSPNSLVIISSYSGNTEETIAALEEALVKRAIIVCITSGGVIEEMASAHGIKVIKVPGGMPPRACLGYSLVQVLHILSFYKITADQFLESILQAADFLQGNQEEIKAESSVIAQKLHGKLPVIYAGDTLEGVAIRLRQQLNENAKMLAWHHVFPELNHNELVGWRKENNTLAIILLRYQSDHPRIGKRMDITIPLFNKYTETLIDITAKGKNTLERCMYLIHLSDWISWYLSELNHVDATEVNVIDHLKKELSKV